MIGALYELTSSHFLVQQVECPTHKDGGRLDLIFTNNGDLIHNMSVLPSLRSDHFLVEVSAVYWESLTPGEQNLPSTDAVDIEKSEFRDLNFFSDKINWNTLEAELDGAVGRLDSRGISSSSMMEAFINTCLSVSREFVPPKKSLPKHRHKIPQDRRILMRRRRVISQRTVATGDSRREALDRRLVDIEKALQQSHIQQTKLEEERAVENIKQNPKFFFAYAKRFSKIRVGIGPLLDATNSLITCPRKMAEVLSEQYRSVFSQPKYPDVRPHEFFPNEPPSGSSITRIIFPEEDLEAAINEL